MYGDTQNTGATRSQCPLDISTFRVSYKAMTIELYINMHHIANAKKPEIRRGKTQVIYVVHDQSCKINTYNRLRLI